MRKWAYAVAALCVTIAAAACGGSSGEVGTTAIPGDAMNNASTTLGVCSARPRRGGAVVYARRAQTEELNPLAVRNGNGDIFAVNQIYDGLVRPDPNGGFGLQPAIADRWSVSPDGKTYTFHIRPGIKFSNGQPVTPEDIKFSLDRFANPKLNQVLSADAVGYQSTEIVNSSTVRVHLSEPVAAFLYNISIYPAFIVPKSLVEKEGNRFFNHPVGTGPYEVADFVRGSHITFQRNPYYWEKGKPYLNSVRFDFAEEDNSRMLDLESGEAQMIDGVPYSQIRSVLGNSHEQLQVVQVPQFLGLWLNHQRAPFQDQKVRQAMQYALNRSEINTAIYRSVGSDPNSVLPHLKFDAGDGQVEPYPYDLAKAKSLIRQSKFPKGFSATLQYPAGFEDYKQLGLYLQQAWAELGIKVKLLQLDQGTVTDQFYAGQYDMTFPYAQFTSDVVVPDEYAGLVSDPTNGTHGFFSWWHDEAIWKQVKRFTTTVGDSRRAEMWPRVQQAMLTLSPFINLLDLPFVNAHQKGVCGTVVDALGSDHLENTWLAARQ
jgi:peptide/nickel transport system substrate-binding protein